MPPWEQCEDAPKNALPLVVTCLEAQVSVSLAYAMKVNFRMPHIHVLSSKSDNAIRRSLHCLDCLYFYFVQGFSEALFNV